MTLKTFRITTITFKPQRMFNTQNMDEKIQFYNTHGESLLQNVIENRVPPISDQPQFIRRFIKNAKTGSKEYYKGLRRHPRQSYDTYWNLESNKNILKNNPRQIPETNPFHEIKDIISYLYKQHSIIKANFDHKIDPWETIPYYAVKYSLNEILQILEHEWDVKLNHIESDFDDYYKFSICGIDIKYMRLRNTKYKHKGTVWVAKQFHFGKDSEICIPVNITDSVIFGPYTEKLLHEFTHAIQNAFTPYWVWDRETIEIAPILIERKYGNGFHNLSISRHISLAIADLESKDASDFDKIYKRESLEYNPESISSRFSHYYTYPRSYYSYVLGLTLPPIIESDFVKFPSAINDFAKSYINRQ